MSLLIFYYQVTRSDLDKLKTTYRQLSRDANNAKEKYREALAKGFYSAFVFVLNLKNFGFESYQNNDLPLVHS